MKRFVYYYTVYFYIYLYVSKLIQAADDEKIQRYTIPEENIVSLLYCLFQCLSLHVQKPSTRYIEPKDEQEVS